MKPKILLRIAAVMMIFHAMGHTFGHATWRQTTDPVKLEVVKQMTEHKFLFMSTDRSMAEYYDGFGLICTVTLLMLATLLWLASSATQYKDFIHKVLTTLGLALLAIGILELLYFFPFAASLSLIASALTLVSIYLLRREA